MANNSSDANVPKRSSGHLIIAASKSDDPLTRILEDLLADDMRRYWETLESALKPQEKYLTDTEFRIYRLGKKIRPIMLLLSARLAHGTSELPQKVIKGAVSLEMLHVATLIHDDIIDDASMRRGLESINSIRGTNTAILMGDMQFVQAIRGFLHAIETDEDMELVGLVLDTAFRICCGELDELNTDPNWEPTLLRERYFETIERKTAILFGMACEAGLSLIEGRTKGARRIGFYGRRVGRSLQIMDDLFDIAQKSSISGKTQGTDLAQRRPTLPIIYAMEELGPDHLVSRIMRGADATPDEIAKGVASIKRTDGFARTYADARMQIIDSLEYLKLFPKNRYRDALEEIAMYVVNRGF